MKHYLCHKEVKAKPMSRGEYLNMRGWQVPHNENPRDEGYLVMYVESPKNHEDYDNYISWSPKDVFEKGYNRKPSTAHERLIIERDELKDRYTKLCAFLFAAPECVDRRQLDLMQQQQQAMSGLLRILNTRIGIFEE